MILNDGGSSAPVTTSVSSLDVLHNPLGAIDSLIGSPTNAIGSITTQISSILPTNVTLPGFSLPSLPNLNITGNTLINTGQQTQQNNSPGATQTSTSTQEKPIIITVASPGTASNSPGASTSAPTSIAPTLDLGGLFGSIGGIAGIAVIGAIIIGAMLILGNKK